MSDYSSQQGNNDSHICFCVGPQNGQPLCPCQMRINGVVKRNGRWIMPEKDLGPVVDSPFTRGFFLKGQSDD